jgi:hypothetical protein
VISARRGALYAVDPVEDLAVADVDLAALEHLRHRARRVANSLRSPL